MTSGRNCIANPILRHLQQRIRDIRESQDGYLYLLTAENQGALIRIELFMN
jgi:glucose/arabinose dehydrogenase